MNLKLTLIGTFAYTIVSFPLAIIWHLVLFEDKYISFGYFEGEPNFNLGLLAIVIQRFVLSLLFPLVKVYGKPITKGIKYSLLVGVFFWTSHVIAFVAKNAVKGSILFIFMETVYLLIQFGIFGILIGVIYGKLDQNDA